MAIIGTPFPPAKSEEIKAPETPLHGVIVSVVHHHTPGVTNQHQVVKLAIVVEPGPLDDSPPEEPLVLFHYCLINFYNDPRNHLKEGDRVKITKVELHWNLVLASEIEFDTKIFYERYLKMKEPQA